MIRTVAPGRLNLKVKPGQPKLYTESYVNDKGWKSSFFFVKKSSLGSEGFWLREEWNSEDWEIPDFGELYQGILDKYLAHSWPEETSIPSTSGLMSAVRGRLSMEEAMRRAASKKRKAVKIDLSETLEASPQRDVSFKRLRADHDMGVNFLTPGEASSSAWIDVNTFFTPAAYKKFSMIEDMPSQCAEHAFQAREEASRSQRQLAERELAFKTSEKKFKEAIDAAEAVMASLKAKVSELDEELLDSAAVSMMERRAKLALEVYSGHITPEDCKKIVDEYVKNIGDMGDLIPKEAGTIVPVPTTPGVVPTEEMVAGETSSTK